MNVRKEKDSARKKARRFFRILGLQSRTAIYNGNYKSILDIVVSGFFLTLPTEIKIFQSEETVTSATGEPFAVSYWPEPALR